MDVTLGNQRLATEIVRTEGAHRGIEIMAGRDTVGCGETRLMRPMIAAHYPMG